MPKGVLPADEYHVYNLISAADLENKYKSLFNMG